jgi:biopolymer transport protein ExbB
MNILELLKAGGPTMIPLFILSFLTVTVIFERGRFWFSVLNKEKELANRILDACRRDWSVAAEIARQAYDQPIGRFLHAPLKLQTPDPELFRFALEAAADEEIASMRRGDKILEAVIAMAPLLGLLGTVLGLITSLGNITVTKMATGEADKVTVGIGEALICTATGLMVALLSLMAYRIFQSFVFNQAKIFRRAGNEMELLHRQQWQLEHASTRTNITAAST